MSHLGGSARADCCCYHAYCACSCCFCLDHYVDPVDLYSVDYGDFHSPVTNETLVVG